MNDLIGILDSCNSNEVRECIKHCNYKELSSYGFITCDSNYSDNEYNCFYLLDTIINNNDKYLHYFGELISDDLYGDYYGEIRKIIKVNYYKHLNNLELSFSIDIDSLRASKIRLDQKIKIWETADSIDGVYIPKDIDDALQNIDSILTKEDLSILRQYKDEETMWKREYFGLCHFLRNYWKLGCSRLHAYFSKLGVSNFDRISTIIVRLYYRKLNNLPLDMDKIIKDLLPYEANEKLRDGEYRNRYKLKQK